MNKLTLSIILGLIIIIASVFRIWKLESIPNAISNDEVIRVYNAHSVWKTGGYTVDKRFLPLSTSADGQDLSPISFYLSAPITGIFGLNLFTARIMYSLVGILSVLGLYLLASKLFNKKVGLLSAFVLAVSPWHILVSRGVWDAGVALCFYIFAIYFFIKFVGKKSLFISILFFILALYSYHGTVLFFGLIVILLFVLHKDQLLKRKSSSILSGMLLFLGTLPMIYALLFGELSRDSMFFWKNPTTIALAEKRILEERSLSNAPEIAKKVFNNKLTYFTKEISYNYLQAYSFEYLFIRGDISRITGYGNYLWGVMNFVEFPFLLLGIYYVLRQKIKTKIIVFTGFLIAPLTSALILLDQTYLFRSIMMLPYLSIFVGVGIYYFFLRFIRFKKILFVVPVLMFCVVYGYFIAKGMYTYFYQYGVFGGEHLFKSSRDVAEYVNNYKPLYKDVYIMSPEYYFLLQYAFYNKIDPVFMQKIWEDRYKKIGNVNIIDWCISKEEFGEPDVKKGILYIAPNTCVHNFDPFTALSDSEEPLRKLWYIYER
jgi:4-amino-4-deoxy-L-arabinose transferase-like glycosyltransferase